ncbi:CsgG/HfaB family protein [Winogradskyella ursingii]|uniref:CsgG/HfaB family protein n=1 Tax=Winogradskyella ursingii TaxID=2686079 RepID=UPI0015CAEC78|nr:CsgG/HfaB family protein [Winogradskyella ursingii]
MKNFKGVAFLLIMMLLSSCGTFFNQPVSEEKARLGESTRVSKILSQLPEPDQKVVVGVYNFRDQTGQFKPTENGSTFSTAVTQGSTAILLKALEDSKWFIPTERENLNNLLNERQIIISTRQEYAQVNGTTPERLRPLLFAGILLEGGIVSYDTNIVTGGIGARYFGIGGSTKYRQDRVTIYLRAVSTSTGEILKTVYVSKTILSQALDANYFRFVSFQRLLEAETGFTRNEPIQLAVTEAVEKAVHSLIIEGISDNLWSPNADSKEEAEELVESYYEEKKVADDTKLYDRLYRRRRAKNVLNNSIGIAAIDGDLPNSTINIFGRIGYKRFLGPYLNLNFSLNQFKLENEEIFEETFTSVDLNAEFVILPFDNLTPFIYSGVGFNGQNGLTDTDLKFQYGAGLEYLVSKTIGLNIFAEHNVMFNDELDGVINGKRDDFYYRAGFGVNFYISSSRDKKREGENLEEIDQELEALKNSESKDQNNQ